MSTFVTARETDRDFLFEVCDDAGECHHGVDDSEAHRSYVFGRGRTIGDDWTMSQQQALSEVRLLEAHRAQPPAVEVVMAVEGTELSPAEDRRE